jgi:adenine-specific DNA methylase
VIGSSQLLKENGKIGFVLPAEILQVSYAIQLREFLAKFYNKIF